ncbi:RIP metalloprotease RseP [Anaerocolumna sedimenticola]|uniref:Zinc metalloprotease n=1 Tax=Anaerocolumna sedimenticola TaxID=2696063 RepID=A0A6P1TQ49_9FIRM|nr:RIP metalloprotease RseP [Anaerocolumna sedimenticola]QHQ62467.1 RIP metalloprotease RseP [Anaerocolumna sedimenticola]
MNIIIAILIFSLIIVIHELGHFLLAKKNGIFVTEFSIGMGPRIISLVKTEKGYRPRFILSQHEFDTTPEWKDTTKYSWKLLPIGGSCIMMGEDEIVEDNRAFSKKGVWARISVVIAGPFFNFLLAFVLAMFIIGVVGYDPASITSVAKDSPAAKAGIQVGDVITKINGNNIDIGRDVLTYLQFNPLSDETVNLTYQRNGEKNNVTLTPLMVKTYMLGFGYQPDEAAASINSVYEDMPLAKAGLQNGDIIAKINNTTIKNGIELNQYFQDNPLSDQPLTITYSRAGTEKTVEITPVLYSENYSIGLSVNSGRVKTDAFGVVKYSAVEVKYWIKTTIESLGQIIRGKVSKDDIAGPVGIVSYIGDTYQASKSEGVLSVFLSLAYISILLSANLGVMNLLPIPALDGGRLVFLILELFRGKPVDQTKEGLVHMIGLVALMILMVFVMFNDISRLFHS